MDQPGHRACSDAAKLRARLESRPRDIVTALKEADCEVLRQGRDCVVAHAPETGRRWRLKGALGEHEFNPE